ncbi:MULTISPECIES: BA14K family protein [Brucella/Ochrobactrum group]|uniref:Lectin-like protein BA14k n=1 Tax=Brucella pseudintermedia TaxID=370111 RepID=A0ABY5UCW3_9HYPH|nr:MULTISPECIES: BA14K family protein [Brucella/Ochrobactrum group]KAB2685365.1 BA14K family protein [Brucella pseudintermedia]NKE76770.1 BA14K family protein [Ochrobactrum sp. MC-1LL]TWG98883.1 BA14K-like protein [Ochrobactrum sp. J50]UWL61175.1 BA14K family protein [Brucella pseudintermedia]WPM79372.1 BA14K family protein [Brucella pseudintermedia]
MNRFAKTAILAAASLAAVAAPLATASADSWGRPGWDRGGWDRPYYRERHRDHSDAVAAGVIGLAAGALLGSALSQPSQPTYVQPAPVYAPPPPPPAYYPAAPVRQATYYRAGYEPWSRGWYQYCSDRYRSFNPNTGTYRGYDGRDHFCSAN